MRSMGWKAITMLAVAVAVLGMSNNAKASLIVGSLGLAGVDPTMNGTDLLTSTTVTTLGTVVTDFPTGNGDYNVVPFLALYSASTVDKTNLSSFSFSSAAYGDFTATSGVI